MKIVQRDLLGRLTGSEAEDSHGHLLNQRSESDDHMHTAEPKNLVQVEF